MNKIVKRVLATSMAVAMVGAAFAGCSAKTDEGTTTNNAEAKTYTVGIAQLVQHEALDAATEGFKEALSEKLGDNVVFVEKDAAGDIPTCATITNGFVADGVDLILANPTPVLQAAAQSTTTIPIVATAVTSFAAALDIADEDWTGATGINVTGTSDLAPLAEQAAMFTELTPNAKKIGIVYCSAEANSVYQAEVIADELAKLGFETKDFTASETNDIAQVVQAACDECDALYIPTDNTMASATGTIEPIVTKANIPVIAGEEGICKGCGVATLSISYKSIGYNAGLMAYDILVNGADPATMDIKVPTKDDVVFKYVADRAEALGLTIPDNYEAMDME
jgi:putative ABC transport system substrate-binding protein